MGNVVYSCCFATAVLWPDGRRERETESPSQTLVCLTPPFPALESDVFSTEPPNELLRKPKDFLRLSEGLIRTS